VDGVEVRSAGSIHPDPAMTAHPARRELVV
jgi:hypothetical protein